MGAIDYICNAPVESLRRTIASGRVWSGHAVFSAQGLAQLVKCMPAFFFYTQAQSKLTCSISQ